MESETQVLREWYDSYTKGGHDAVDKNHPLVQAVVSDTLDEARIEQQICQLASDIHVTNEICHKCQHMFDNWPIRSPSHSGRAELLPFVSYARAGSYHTLSIEASSRCGCKFCAFLLQLLKDQDILAIFRRIEARLEKLGEVAEFYFCVDSTEMMVPQEQRSWLELPSIPFLEHYSDPECTQIKCVSIDERVCASQDEDIFAIASHWLRTCLGSHESCNTAMDNHRLPTRLVSIANGAPHLDITSDWRDRGSPLRYATLSYCWGSRPFLRLTKSNLSDFTKRIPMDALPPTFTDAMKIANALGISYIWIDSLCIVQDDEDDWRKEADLMQSVYTGSHINIAAASATDSHGGCFARTPSIKNTVQVKVTAGGTQETKAFVSLDMYKVSVLNSHLMTRGWAIQEKLLAPRTIHFGDRGAIWECKNMVLSEWYPGTFSLLRSPSNEPYLVYRRAFDYYDWEAIVKAYSAAKLTHRRDKIPALAGIARAVANATGEDYVVGLWKQDIEAQLCWSLIGSRRTRKRPSIHDPEWIAPSWSWASIDGPVEVGCLECQYAHVFKTAITFSGPRPFGQPSSGVLHMNCSGIIAGRLRQIALPDWLHSGYTESVTVDSSDGQKLFPVKIDCVDDCLMYDNQTVYLIPLGTALAEPQAWRFVLRGIVMRKPNDAPGVFCRIGIFDFPDIFLPHQRNLNHIKIQTPWKIPYLIPDTTTKGLYSEIVNNSEFPEEKYVISLI